MDKHHRRECYGSICNHQRKERIRFEKEHQVPYGYATGIFISNLMEALSVYAEIPREVRDDYIIEKISNDVITVIYPEGMKNRFAGE